MRVSLFGLLLVSLSSMAQNPVGISFSDSTPTSASILITGGSMPYTVYRVVESGPYLCGGKFCALEQDDVFQSTYVIPMIPATSAYFVVKGTGGNLSNAPSILVGSQLPPAIVTIVRPEKDETLSGVEELVAGFDTLGVPDGTYRVVTKIRYPNGTVIENVHSDVVIENAAASGTLVRNQPKRNGMEEISDTLTTTELPGNGEYKVSYLVKEIDLSTGMLTGPDYGNVSRRFYVGN